MSHRARRLATAAGLRAGDRLAWADRGVEGRRADVAEAPQGWGRRAAGEEGGGRLLADGVEALREWALREVAGRRAPLEVEGRRGGALPLGWGRRAAGPRGAEDRLGFRPRRPEAGAGFRPPHPGWGRGRRAEGGLGFRRRRPLGWGSRRRRPPGWGRRPARPACRRRLQGSLACRPLLLRNESEGRGGLEGG